MEVPKPYTNVCACALTRCLLVTISKQNNPHPYKNGTETEATKRKYMGFYINAC